MNLVIPGKPVPASRPRITKGHAYYPPKYQSWLEAATWEVKRQRSETITGPVKLTVRFFIDRVEVEVTPGKHRPSKLWGDLDNLIVGVMNACQAGGLLADDRQVTEVEVTLG